MDVISTRGSGEKVPALEAVLQGIARNGGLFVPEFYPQLDMAAVLAAERQGYPTLAAHVLGQFFDMPEDELLKLAKEAYATFDTAEVVPIRALGDREHVMELTHGPTLAFKDMALQVLPRLTQAALARRGPGEDILILTATSGDTGKAALEGFRDVPRTAIFVFYPNNGVARMQKLQMVTQEGSNTGVSAVEGNFDDAQTGVKKLFADTAFQAKVREKGYALSSANSINFGRLAPQVAYYVYAYAHLVSTGAIQEGEEICFCVPTGNFGNILAAYYAKRMGIPVGKLICASNANNVLTDFFHTGKYNSRREFHKTMSPSMDILISSNLERLLFELSGRDAGQVVEWMEALSSEGAYEVSPDVAKGFEDLIWSAYMSEKDTARTIHDTFGKERYLMDPHTAVAQGVFEKYRQETGDDRVVVTVSTANPYKFTPDVLKALTGRYVKDAFEAAAKLSEYSGTPIPEQISGLADKPVLHGGCVANDGMGQAVLDFVEGLGE